MDFYAPENQYLWDFWLIEAGKTFHLYHLQAPRSLSPEERHHQVSIGYAQSQDLKTWQPQGTILTPGEAGAWDDLALWTGSIIPKDGRYYMFYTGRSQRQFYTQKIGLAFSDNLKDWEKHPNNPILEADLQHYAMQNAPNTLDTFPAWRDPYVFQLPNSQTYYMLLTARSQGQNQEHNGCIAIAESANLLDWQLHPPLLAPGIYDEMEVPQLIFHAGRYYLFFSTWHKSYHPQHADIAQSGLHCYVADALFGNYQPVNGHGIVRPGEDLYAMRVFKQGNGDQFWAMGFLNTDLKGDFIGRLSAPFALTLKGDQVYRNDDSAH